MVITSKYNVMPDKDNVCIVGRRKRGIQQYDTWILTESGFCCWIKGTTLDFVCWLKEPTQNQLTTIIPCLRQYNRPELGMSKSASDVDLLDSNSSGLANINEDK